MGAEESPANLAFARVDRVRSLQEVGWQTYFDLRSDGGDRTGFLEFAAQYAGFFSEENAQAMNGDIDSTD